MSASRRFALRTLAWVPALAASGRLLGAEGFPSKPVRIVVPFPPGGSNDVLARVLSDSLGAAWKQPVIVENRPGAAGNIGADLVAKSPADGYNLLIAGNSILTMNPALFARLPFDPVRDLASVSLIGTVPIVLAVRTTLKADSVKALIDLAKGGKVALTYGSGGIGSPQHLSAEMFRSLTGTNLVHVPYKGAVPAITDLLAGEIDMMFGAVNSLLPHFRSGRLRPLGMGGRERFPLLPEVPTIAEAGVPGYDSSIWIGLSVARGTPQQTIDTVNRGVRAALNQPGNQSKLREQGINPVVSSPAGMDELIATDLKRWTQVIRAAGVKAD